MVKRIGGLRRKARHKLKKNVRAKGKISLSKFFQSFKLGERVNLVTEPAVQRGGFHLRFQGKAGVIKKKQGSCYYVEIKDYKKPKLILAHPIHLKKCQK